MLLLKIKKGFTLTETLLVIGISLLITSSIFVGYRYVVNGMKIDKTTTEIINIKKDLDTLTAGKVVKVDNNFVIDSDILSEDMIQNKKNIIDSWEIQLLSLQMQKIVIFMILILIK